MSASHHNPKRIAEVRTMVGITQAELARRMEISPGLVSYWESGDRNPSPEQLGELARHLGVSLDYLVKDKVQPAFQYRSKPMGDDMAAADIAKMQVDASAQIDYIDEVFRLAQQPMPTFLHWSEFSFPACVQLCRQYRQLLGLNRRVTLVELKQALTEQGIFVFEWDLPDNISGMSYRGGITAIFINHLHQPTRRLFTLAHELAHVLFHLGRHKEETGSFSVIGNNQDPQEKEANAFASELLMPLEDVKSIVDRYGERLLDSVLMECIARQFNVSRDAILYRLTQLKLCNWKEHHVRFASPFEKGTPRDTRVTNITEQVPSSLAENALSLHLADQVPTQKFADWLFTDTAKLDEFLKQLAKVKKALS